jgi:DNA-directed RNA polymerase subunit RPC12/RpoP
MKVTVEKITTTASAIELPDACATCGQEFHESSSLIELKWVPGEQACSVSGDGYVDDYGSFESPSGDDIVCGYKCGGCGAVLALEQEHRGPVSAAPAPADAGAAL